MSLRIPVVAMCFLSATSLLPAESGWVDYKGGDGPGAGKKIVLISGDEEYRSEETMPMLGKILAVRHGFDCRVVFSMASDGETIDPNRSESLEGLSAMKDADLMIIFTRFRRPNDQDMQLIDDYIQQGKPVIGLRTATHGFNGLQGKFAHYNNGHDGEKWQGGFGREILGEQWVNHHGHHGRQSTRGILTEAGQTHPIVKGIRPGEIWGTTDVYGVRPPLPGDSFPLVLGQVLVGMNRDDAPLEGEKNDPMMPVAWVKTYTTDDGKVGRVFNTTMGASQDYVEPGLRRLTVNAVYWCLGMEDQINPDSNVDLVGEFKTSPFGFKPKTGYWKEKNLKPSQFELK